MTVNSATRRLVSVDQRGEAGVMQSVLPQRQMVHKKETRFLGRNRVSEGDRRLWGAGHLYSLSPPRSLVPTLAARATAAAAWGAAASAPPASPHVGFAGFVDRHPLPHPLAARP